MQIKHNMTRLAASVALAGSLALAGCGSKDDAPPPQGPAEVGVITLSPQSLDVTTTLPGRTTASACQKACPASVPGAADRVSSRCTIAFILCQAGRARTNV